MMELIYRLIVLYLAVHVAVYLIRQKKFWNQLGAVVVLLLFVLRLLLIK